MSSSTSSIIKEFSKFNGHLYVSIGQTLEFSVVSNHVRDRDKDKDTVSYIPIRLGLNFHMSPEKKIRYSRQAYTNLLKQRHLKVGFINIKPRLNLLHLDYLTGYTLKNKPYSYKAQLPMSLEWSCVMDSFIYNESNHEHHDPYTLHEKALAFVLAEWSYDTRYIIVGQYGRECPQFAIDSVLKTLKNNGVTDMRSFISWARDRIS